MAFHFRLESLLRHRQRIKDEANRDHAEAQARVVAKINEIKALYNEIDQTREKISSLYEGGLGMIQYMNDFLDGTKLRITRARYEVRDLMQVAEEKHERLVEASREVRMLEKLREKRRMEYLKEKKRKATKLTDDMISNRWGVK